MEEKSGNLMKVETKLKEGRSSYKNVMETVKKKRDEKRKEERKWEEIFGREVRKRQDR